jgi:hypothetical protein
MRAYFPERREGRVARCPVCLLRVFLVYSKVGDSGDVVIPEQGSSIVDTREPAVAMTLLPIFLHTMAWVYPHSDQIFLIGRH